jgi:hypothetical protein
VQRAGGPDDGGGGGQQHQGVDLRAVGRWPLQQGGAEEQCHGGGAAGHGGEYGRAGSEKCAGNDQRGEQQIEHRVAWHDVVQQCLTGGGCCGEAKCEQIGLTARRA